VNKRGTTPANPEVRVAGIFDGWGFCPAELPVINYQACLTASLSMLKDILYMLYIFGFWGISGKWDIYLFTMFCIIKTFFSQFVAISVDFLLNNYWFQ
jgi:hypothetical protein